MESNLDDPGEPDVTTRVPMGEAGGQRAEKPYPAGTEEKGPTGLRARVVPG